MQSAANIISSVKASYTIAVMGVLGLFAFISAVLIAWPALAYLGAKLFSGPTKFVLGGSGHIAGIVNPPAANKYGYWTNDTLPETADEFLAGATQHAGSWWTDWQAWLLSQTNGEKKVPARKPGAGNLPVLEDAPGSYVKFRLDTEKKQ